MVIYRCKLFKQVQLTNRICRNKILNTVNLFYFRLRYKYKLFLEHDQVDMKSALYQHPPEGGRLYESYNSTVHMNVKSNYMYMVCVQNAALFN